MIRVISFCFTFLFLLFRVSAFSNDLYWISYLDNGTHLMEIDSKGNVVKAPALLSQEGTVISRNGTKEINLWNDEHRVVLDKKTLAVVKKVKNSIGTPNSLTNKTQKNFATRAGSEQLTLSFLGVSSTGVPNGASWEISSRNKGGCAYVVCPQGVVSSDGRTILWMTRSFIFTSPNLSIQPLTDTGRTDGSEKIVNNEDEATSGAVSNVLADGKIFLLYLVSVNAPRELFLQAADARTGQRIGDKILLRNARFVRDSIGIDPLGRFVIYAYENAQGASFLVFQAIDETGHRTGPSKILVRKTNAFNVHLLKD